jgi:enoyl-CoA hydratase/carnithine racemase
VAACDLAVASEEASFAVPGVKIGLFCSTPMVPLSRAVGRKKALEMLLTGEPITAGEALAQGLVNRVVPTGDLDAEVGRLVEILSGFSRAVVAGGKETFYRQMEMTEAEAYRTTACTMAENAGGGEAREGISAFLEKREARWEK